MTSEKKTMETNREPKIMSMPLPMILDELEKYIQQVAEAVKASREAAAMSAEKADEAKLSGKLAGEAARKAAEAAVAQVEKKTQDEFAALRAELESVALTAGNALALAQAMNRGIALGVKGYNSEIEKL
jgi:hypothetical protein